jgi:hypothetical protein
VLPYQKATRSRFPVDKARTTTNEIQAAEGEARATHADKNMYAGRVDLLRFEEEDRAVPEVEVDEVLSFCGALVNTARPCTFSSYHA